jgi:hypothetical protein
MGQGQSQDAFTPPGVFCCDSTMEHEVRWKKRQSQLNSPTPRAVPPQPEMRKINATVRHAPAAATKGTDKDLKLEIGNTGQVVGDAEVRPKQLSSGDLGASTKLSELHSPVKPDPHSRLSSSRSRQTNGTECLPVGRMCQFADDKTRCGFCGKFWMRI